MPRYLLSICYPADAQQPEPEALARIMDDVGAIYSELVATGSWIFGGGLHPPASATTVLEQDGRTVLTDGPFIESKEQIGGITVIDVADLDAALAWASRCSAATSTPIEVRPFMQDGTG